MQRFSECVRTHKYSCGANLVPSWASSSLCFWLHPWALLSVMVIPAIIRMPCVAIKSLAFFWHSLPFLSAFPLPVVTQTFSGIASWVTFLLRNAMSVAGHESTFCRNGVQCFRLHIESETNAAGCSQSNCAPKWNRNIRYFCKFVLNCSWTSRKSSGSFRLPIPFPFPSLTQFHTLRALTGRDDCLENWNEFGFGHKTEFPILKIIQKCLRDFICTLSVLFGNSCELIYF